MVIGSRGLVLSCPSLTPLRFVQSLKRGLVGVDIVSDKTQHALSITPKGESAHEASRIERPDKLLPAFKERFKVVKNELRKTHGFTGRI